MCVPSGGSSSCLCSIVFCFFDNHVHCCTETWRTVETELHRVIVLLSTKKINMSERALWVSHVCVFNLVCKNKTKLREISFRAFGSLIYIKYCIILVAVSWQYFIKPKCSVIYWLTVMSVAEKYLFSFTISYLFFSLERIKFLWEFRLRSLCKAKINTCSSTIISLLTVFWDPECTHWCAGHEAFSGTQTVWIQSCTNAKGWSYVRNVRA